MLDIIKEIGKIPNVDVIGENECPVETLGQVTHVPGDMTYCTFVADEKYIYSLSDGAKMIITTEDLAEKIKKSRPDMGFAIVNNPEEVFFKLHNSLVNSEEYSHKQEPNQIGQNVRISNNVRIADHNVRIGDDVIIEENVVIRENTTIGSGSIIRAGVIIGGEGFEFKKSDGGYFGITHGGGVVIGDNVEIQYHSCIDKALYPWDNTVIGDYSKIDDLVYIAHGAKTGTSVLIAAHAVIGGRVKIGSNTWIGFGATIRNGIEIGDNCRANMGSVITKNIESGHAVSGNFAIDHSKFIDKIKEQ